VTVSGFIPRTDCLAAMESDSPVLRSTFDDGGVAPDDGGHYRKAKPDSDPLDRIGPALHYQGTPIYGTFQCTLFTWMILVMNKLGPIPR